MERLDSRKILPRYRAEGPQTRQRSMGLSLVLLYSAHFLSEFANDLSIDSLARISAVSTGWSSSNRIDNACWLLVLIIFVGGMSIIDWLGIVFWGPGNALTSRRMFSSLGFLSSCQELGAYSGVRHSSRWSSRGPLSCCLPALNSLRWPSSRSLSISFIRSI